MDTVRIDIINPKARKLLEDLEELNLIAIKKDKTPVLHEILKDLRKPSDQQPTDEILSLEDVAQEVNAVRARRYGK